MNRPIHAQVHALLFREMPSTSVDSLRSRAIQIARIIQTRATELQTPHERAQQHELDQLIQNPADKATLMSMTDQAFRSDSSRRAMDQLIHILDVQGIPQFFGRFDRTLLQGLRTFGSYLPGVATPLVREKMQRETANVILPAEEEHLTEHLQQRQQDGIRMNVNLLGEAVLGEQEAERRLRDYHQLLELDELEVLSVKISNLYSQNRPVSRDCCVPILCDRFESLLRKATRETFTRAGGTQVPKMIYLDMEEYRDMEITAEMFAATLDRAGLERARAGIALQAYLPDSYAVQQRITEWAQQRTREGKSPITIRIVKGANMEMERVEASIAGWAQAPFQSKLETDANYKRMLTYGLADHRAKSVHLGIASHNLLDLSYALAAAADADAFELVQFEMLEGMANHQRRALHEVANNLLLYAPACKQDDFINSIGYLIRRLDENTGPANFLRHAFRIEVESKTWMELESQFIDSFTVTAQLNSSPRRLQKSTAAWNAPPSWRNFQGSPPTDFILPPGRQLALDVYSAIENQDEPLPLQVVSVINGKSPGRHRETLRREDPSVPGREAVITLIPNPEDMARAVPCAHADPDAWGRRSPQERCDTLLRVATAIKSKRRELMTVAMLEVGKSCEESDPEVSEAVDLLRFYAITAEEMSRADSIDTAPHGPVVVLSPWNFPIAIPCGGISAALATGNCVILKPAPAAAATAQRLCQIFWECGISKSTLQLVPCFGRDAGTHLLGHPQIDSVILTGGTRTAEAILKENARLRLFAETGGKNSTIVTAISDRDLAIKHVAYSAFGFSGQKCSATSLLILEAEVYDDPQFQSALVDAVASLPVGSAWNPATRIGPLIDPPKNDLLRAIQSLDKGERWALEPAIDSSNTRLVHPGIKWDVRTGSYSHLTEFFGPILSVMRADDLDHAIQIANDTPYGLTAGLESLDDREQDTWGQKIRAGNLYINRPTTGAIVLRQPFGGFGKSCFGPGFKAGGPHYVNLFTRFSHRPTSAAEAAPLIGPLQQFGEWLHKLKAEEILSTPAVHSLTATLHGYEDHYIREFSGEHDHFLLVGQDNIRRYLPVERLMIRIEADDSVEDVLLRIACGYLTDLSFSISLSPKCGETIRRLASTVTACDPDRMACAVVEEDQLCEAIIAGECKRIRYSGESAITDRLRATAHLHGTVLIESSVAHHGMIELAWYFREQSLSVDYHRYGNLGHRSGEKRQMPR
ncbi:MAG: bifunctional proline dehydrogenase/L-glutamate gamma-semialdehyde dehydrogenase [Pirellulales bacterium]|nr:bifunctional proline dehydrogenase/L-glutamate gamma-semialdehyde dehydrogenase [Pirellulales bacterium]